MKNCRIVIFVTKCTEKVVKSLYFHSKIAVFQNPLVRARGNLSLGPCFSGCPDPNGPQKICEILAGQIEASKVICPAVRLKRVFHCWCGDSTIFRRSLAVKSRISRPPRPPLPRLCYMPQPRWLLRPRAARGGGQILQTVTRLANCAFPHFSSI